MRISALGISIIGAALILTGCGKKDQTIAADPIPVKAETVATQEIRTAWRYSGQIEPETQVQLAFKQPRAPTGAGVRFRSATRFVPARY